jgi:hypothetical protein
MKKLRLQIEELRVERFEVEPESVTARGTVYGRETYSPYTCYCGPWSDPHTEPCAYCPEMPITYSCEGGKDCG